jgi:hypothetical protein
VSVPDFMPVLSGGSHANPKDGACVMEYVSFLAGESWSDRPDCTHPVLAAIARNVNDRLGDGQRQVLVPLIPRLLGTASDDRVLSVRLAIWCARGVQHLVSEKDRGACEAAVGAAEAWVDCPCEGHAKAARYAADAAADAADVYADAAAADAAADPVGFLTGLLDEYDRLTGRTRPAPLSDADLARLTKVTA